MNLRILLAASFLLPAMAAAPSAGAANCRDGLTPQQRMIYDAALPAVHPGVTIRDIVTSKTRGLVMSGKLSRAEARPAAQVAGECLKATTP